MDRVSRAALNLGTRAAELGAVVVFEPSGRSDPKLFQEAPSACSCGEICGPAPDRSERRHGEPAANTLLEIQTLGSRGLQYRHPAWPRGISKWIHLEAVAAPRISDTCGSGDWCTAGLLAKVAGRWSGAHARRRGQRASVRHYVTARRLRHGTARSKGRGAACMRSIATAFDRQIIGLLEGQPSLPVAEVTPTFGSAVACPACPPDRPGSGPTLSLGARGAQKKLTAA